MFCEITLLFVAGTANWLKHRLLVYQSIALDKFHLYGVVPGVRNLSIDQNRLILEIDEQSMREDSVTFRRFSSKK